MRFLNEEKLRALGVSFGDEDVSQPPTNPASRAMSRTSSAMPSGLPMSPPIPASSAASNHIRRGTMFSPPFSISANASSHMGSIASPVSQMGKTPTFNGNNQPFTSPFAYPQQQPTPPAQMPDYFAARARSGTNSPATFGNLQSLGSILSPSVQSVQTPYDDTLNRMRIQQQQLQNQLLQQQQQQQQQMLNADYLSYPNGFPRVHADGAPLTPKNTELDIHHPTPRGHHQNLSQNLQKEIDNAEYHLEESISRQLEDEERELEMEERREPARTRGFTNKSGRLAGEQGLYRPPHARGNSLSQRQVNGHRSGLTTDASDLDTNPSLSGTPVQRDASDQGKPAIDSISRQAKQSSESSFSSEIQNGHRAQLSRSSASKLNVEAKPFSFNPSSSSATPSFGLGQNPFHPASTSFNPATSSFKPVHMHRNSSSIGNTSFNVEAPSFTPGLSQQSSMPSGDFNFSSSFQAQRPALNPSYSTASSTMASGSEAPSQPPNKIFGGLDFSNYTKPPKQSKAVPIVRPDQIDNESEKDHQEDIDGRITQADGRTKRSRFSDRGGDSVPLFATPTIPLTETGQAQSPRRDTSKATLPASNDKENDILSTAAPETEKTARVPPSLEAVKESLEKGNVEHAKDDNNWSPHVFENKTDAEEFNAANSTLPPPIGRHEDNVIDMKGVLPSEDGKPRIIGNESESKASETRPKASSLSATAKPFEFKIGGQSPPQPTPQVTSKPVALKSLAESRFAHSSVSSISDPEPEMLERAKSPILRSRSSSIDRSIAESQQIPIAPYPAEDVATEIPREPTMQEIDDIMRHLNEDSDVGIEMADSSHVQTSPDRGRIRLEEPTPILRPTNNFRSDAPSPSPGRQEHILHIPQESTDIEVSPRQDEFGQPHNVGLGIRSPVHRLNREADVPISDWDDAFSPGEDIKLHDRSSYFDSRLYSVVGDMIDNRFVPLEQTLGDISEAMTRLATRTSSRKGRRSPTADIEHSDADDEDDLDDEHVYRPRTPKSRQGRQTNEIKAAVLEAMTSHLASTNIKDTVPTIDPTTLGEVLAEMKRVVAEAADSSKRQDDVKSIMEEVIATHPRLVVPKSHEDATVERFKLQISGLEAMIRAADERADDQFKARQAIAEELAETKRQLKFTEADASELKEAAEEAERSLQMFYEDRSRSTVDTSAKLNALESQQETYRREISDLSAKNEALEDTLKEYRLSNTDWKEEMADAKAEHKALTKTVYSLRQQMEDSVRSRHNLHEKFDKLQEDMCLAAKDIARDQAEWRRKDSEHRAHQDMLVVKLEEESVKRERLEREIERLEVSEKQALKNTYALEESDHANAKLRDLVEELKRESSIYQNNAAKFERDFQDARESARIEVSRVRLSLESEIESANNQVNMTRANLESEISRLQNKIEDLKSDADMATAKHEMQLEEAYEARRNAIFEAKEATQVALDEQRRVAEEKLNGLRERHMRAMHNSSEDKLRLESHLNEVVNLERSKVEHLQDKVVHLEERLEITKAAAQAAAEAAKAAGRPIASPPPHPIVPSTKMEALSSPSMSMSAGSNIPEKISPQALRESIMVLQEQLHEREGRIERMEQEMGTFDKDAPNKLKEKDTEISWLRELLGVRVDDLQDIITVLSQPSYDREAARDAAIRLKANLQMEQQEKERAMSGGQTFPSLSSLKDLAASSPRALPLAAAAAWGNWRKSSGLSDLASSVTNTPSKPKPSQANQGFMSGLMTPKSNVRRSSSNTGVPPIAPFNRQVSSEARPLRSYNNQARPLSSRQQQKRPMMDLPENFQPDVPSTPPLMRKASYDSDAKSHHEDQAGSDDAADISSTDDGFTPLEEPTGPFGPAIVREGSV